MKEQKRLGNKGFSLVELIVVIAIMAVLVGVLAPQFIKYVEKGRISTDIQNIDQAKSAIEVYLVENSDNDAHKLFAADASTLSDKTVAITDTVVQDALEDAGLPKENFTFKSGKWTGVNVEVDAYGKVTVKGSATAGSKTYKMDGTVE